MTYRSKWLFEHASRQPWLIKLICQDRPLDVVWIWSQTMAWLAKRYHRHTSAHEQESFPWRRALDGCDYDLESILNRSRSTQGQPPRKQWRACSCHRQKTRATQSWSRKQHWGVSNYMMWRCLGRPLPRQRWLCCRTSLCFRSFECFSGVTWKTADDLQEQVAFRACLASALVKLIFQNRPLAGSLDLVTNHGMARKTIPSKHQCTWARLISMKESIVLPSPWLWQVMFAHLWRCLLHRAPVKNHCSLRLWFRSENTHKGIRYLVNTQVTFDICRSTGINTHNLAMSQISRTKVWHGCRLPLGIGFKKRCTTWAKNSCLASTFNFQLACFWTLVLRLLLTLNLGCVLM